MFPKLITLATLVALGLAPCADSQAAGRRGSAGREDALGRTVFQVLVGEFAMQRQDVRLASDAWSDLAVRTREPKVIARATEVASFARQYDRALELTRLWLEVEPDSTRALQTQASLLVLANRIDELAAQLALLLEKDKANLSANLMHLNRMLARHNDRTAAQRLIERVVAPYEALPEAHFAIGQAASSAGNPERALREMEQALALRPDWEVAALARAQLQARHSGVAAIEGLESFVTAYPGAREARLTLARLFIAERQYEAARRHFERLLQDNPDSPEIAYPVAMLALQQGDLKTGRAQLERLLLTDFPDKSTLHFFLGQLDQEQKQPEAALAHYRQVSSGEQYILARSRLAQLLAQQGKPEEARQVLRETRTGNAGERTQLTLAEVQLLREAGRHGEAYVVLDTALASQPDNTELLYDAALTAERIGKPELLETHLAHLLQLKPDHAHALNALGYSLAERNQRLDEAHALVTRALALEPDDPFIIDSLGWVLYRRGRLEEALLTLKRAYGLKADPEIAAHLGEVLWHLDRRDEARRLLRDASRQHPDNEVLAGTLKKLVP